MALATMLGPAVQAASGGEMASSLMGGGSPMGWISAASSLMDKATPGAPAGPSISGADSEQRTSSVFDNSGWTVSIGSGQASASSSKTAGELPWNYILIAAVVGLLVWKRA